jgi:biopolymer transport protein ExbB
MGFDHLIHQLDFVGWVVLITLVVMSFRVVLHGREHAQEHDDPQPRRQGRLARSGKPQRAGRDPLHGRAAGPSRSPRSRSTAPRPPPTTSARRQRLVESLNRSEFIDRALRQAVTRESAKLESGLTLLATVGSTAPFVGLLGTVWGIYHALIRSAPAATPRSTRWPARSARR